VIRDIRILRGKSAPLRLSNIADFSAVHAVIRDIRILRGKSGAA
jgi:hypothetical protein